MNQLADFEPVNRRSVRLRFLLLGVPLFLVLIRFLIAALPTGAQQALFQGPPLEQNWQNPRVVLTSTVFLTQSNFLPVVLNTYPIAYPHRITLDSFNNTEPRFSPDGRSVVFISDRAGNTDVFSIDVDGGLPINLTQSARSEDTPVFSPDGTTIAYASNAGTHDGCWAIFTMSPDGSNKQIAIDYFDESHEIQPWFSPDGQSLYFSSNVTGNWEIFQAPIGSDYFSWTQLTHNAAADRFPVLSPDGTTVIFRSERDGNSEIYLMDADGSNQRRFTNSPDYESFGSIISDMSGVVYDSESVGVSKSYLANPAATGVIALETRSGWHMAQSDISSDGLWRVYASKPEGGAWTLMVDHFVSPLMAIGATGFAASQNNCDWESGVLAYGWSYAWETMHQNQALDWLKSYVNRCLPGKTISHVNDATLAHVALVVYQSDPQPVYLNFAQDMADWLMTTAQRTPDGTLSHMNDGDSVWCDTMLSVPPFLVRMSQVTGDVTYFDEAVDQVLKHADHLQDPGTGLYHHAWSAAQNGYLGPAYWGRGNGWVLLGDVAVLSVMTDTHPLRPTLLSIYRDQAAALLPLQDSSGLWHNVVNHTDFYLETSGTALIGYALEQGVAEGWLDNAQFVPSVESARLGMWRKILAGGMVTDVMAPTGPLPNDAIYNTLPHSELQLYGQGVSLLFESP